MNNTSDNEISRTLAIKIVYEIERFYREQAKKGASKDTLTAIRECRKIVENIIKNS